MVDESLAQTLTRLVILRRCVSLVQAQLNLAMPCRRSSLAYGLMDWLAAQPPRRRC
ncbi:MAG TPA: hypothetical protein VJ843_00525 [Candidatus Saccharimonadales bacterium]|nr:hypothetical protein [Candidatus Saccharimonadales bacterium]